tara:strand:+ start:6201 stop:7304 length:1104 start_codon:yes stop_codon:yes gene_type:complete
MHYFIFPTQDTWISSGSNKITGETFTDQNFGGDQILEIKKEFFNRTFDHHTRALVNFAGTGFNTLSQSIVDGTIPSDAKFFLRMFEAQGNSDMSADYKIAVQPISQSWTEGTGKFGDDPKTTNGCSFNNRSFPEGGAEVPWANAGASVYGKSGSLQTFSNQSPDIEVEVTDMVNMWLQGQEENYGMRVNFKLSQETDETTFGKLKFFSRNTHTIYAPRLEARWDGHSPCTGSNTGSLTQLDVSGNTDNFIYTIALNDKYRETDIPKFRIGARAQFIQKSFTNSFNIASGSFIPEGSGSYAIVDVATGEKVIDFSDNSKLSCDSKSNYFIEYMNGFYPDRTYKILIKVKYDDEQERIYDNDFEFKLVR